MRIALLMTGNELMSGVTVDSNSAMIARRLEPLNLRVQQRLTIGDDPQRLVDELRRLSIDQDLLLVNGGLGPTVDDLTAECLARAAGVPLVEYPEARVHVESWCERRGFAPNQANLKQARLPEGSTIVHNPVGSALGFRLTLNGCEVVCTPGVPGELRAMLDEQILPWLDSRAGQRDPVTITRFQLFGIGESTIQQQVSDHHPDWPATIELGFRAGAPSLEVKVSSFSARDEQARLHCEQIIRDRFADHIFTVGDQNLQTTLVNLLRERGRRMVTAESCTGGLMASMLTEVPGSSAMFEGAYVSYSYAMKQSMLGVSSETLAAHGAVSEAVVLEMARGALRHSGADYVVAVSGVAGPDGGSDDKPVGTVWISWGRSDDLRARAFWMPRARTLFQLMVAATGLDLIRRMELGIQADPRYFQERALRPGT